MPERDNLNNDLASLRRIAILLNNKNLAFENISKSQAWIKREVPAKANDKSILQVVLG